MPDIEFSDRPKRVSLVKPARGEMSEMLLPLTHSAVRLVKPAKAEISEITLLAANPKCVNLVKPATGEMSDTELFQKSRYVRLVACSNPVRLRTPASGSSRCVKVAISDGIIEIPARLAESGLNRSAEIGVGEVHHSLHHGVKSYHTLNSSGRYRDGLCSYIWSQCERTLCRTIFIGGGACDAERTTACGDSKCDRDPFKCRSVLIPYFNDKWVRYDRAGHAVSGYRLKSLKVRALSK